MTNNPKTEEKKPVANSILADASTLLMFSSGNKSQDAPSSEIPPMTNSMKPQPITHASNSDDRQLPVNASQVEYPEVSHDTSIEVNNGQAPEEKSNFNENSPSRESSNSAAVAAAAALATAATIPLPLKKHVSDMSPKNPEEKNAGNPEIDTKASQQVQHKKWPVPDSYIVDPDSGIITCVCGFNDDDGFTIQCDHCYRWQHAVCYGIELINDVPEQYLCNACQPRKIDAKAAYLRQKKQRDALQAKPQQNNNAEQPEDDKDAHSEDTNVEDDNQANTNTKSRTSKTNSQKTAPTVTAASIVPDIRRKEHLLHPKDGFPSVYRSIDANQCDDRYIKLFMDKHRNDDCVTTYNHREFRSIPIEVKSYSESNNSRYFPGFMKLGVYIQDDCTKDDFITEVVGQLDFQKKYLNDPRNHYRIWGTPKRKVIFHEHWPLIIDQRSCGNFSRFLRRSCNPNVQLVTLRMPDNSIKFVLQAMSDIQSGDELYIGWQWDLRHPIIQMINGTSDFESFDDVVKYSLIHSVDTILSNCECGCGNNNKECHLLRVKKISQSLVKMVKSKTSNRYKLNQILSNYQLNSKKRDLPVLHKLVKDANTVSTGNNDALNSGILNINFKDQPITDGNAKSDNAITETKDTIRTEPEGKRFKRSNESFVKTLVRNKRARHLPGKSFKDFEKSLRKFDESDVNDLESLPIPIILSCTSQPPTSTIVNNDTLTSNTTEAMTRKDSESKISTGNNFSSHIMNYSGASQPDTTGGHEQPVGNAGNHVNSKKKLSFADYRKKLQK